MKKLTILTLLVFSLNAPSFSQNASDFSQNVSSFSQNVSAQSYDEILFLVRNSVQLRSISASVQAQKDAASTDLLLPNPEVELGYQLGDPHKTVPNRTLLTVKQEFDYATLSGQKRAVAKETQKLLDYQYSVAEWQAVVEARQLLAELTYYNIRIKELGEREQQARALNEAYQKALNKGAATILDANKAAIDVESCRSEKQLVNTEREAKLAQLSLLCNLEINFPDTIYHQQNLPQNFDEWFLEMQQHHPQLLQSAQSIILAKQTVQLEKANNKPKFSFGYSGEMVRGNNYHGVVVGLSIPLWGNKERMKAAQSAITQAEEQRTSEMLTLHANYRQQYLRVKQLSKLAEENRRFIALHDNRVLLLKALNAGNLTLINYLQELSYCYNLIDKLQEIERDTAINSAVF